MIDDNLDLADLIVLEKFNYNSSFKKISPQNSRIIQRKVKKSSPN